ncbi:EFR1 family ferrodoxin [Pelotomaculum propionicicum]|uniref:EFR1 family ferrodoxin n=1 Tax=Pelotomaculum propionicicum TaxID=258475 RepID=UPI003B7C07DD
MPVNKISQLCFSPTGTTKQIIETIAESIPYEKQVIDFTAKRIRENKFNSIKGDVAIIGSPVYYGKVPNEVRDFFSKVHVDNIHAVLVVVYGNREYEDALKELYDVTCAAGFIPVACAVFIGEHSYSSDKLPIAQGRPDKTDLEKAKLFGTAVQEKLDILINYDNTHKISIPGSSEYKNRTIPRHPVAPVTIEGQCTLCGMCIDICPVEAVSISENTVITSMDSCMLCFACVKKCPASARVIDDVRWSKAMEMLQGLCSVRKEPEVFF